MRAPLFSTLAAALLLGLATAGCGSSGGPASSGSSSSNNSSESSSSQSASNATISDAASAVLTTDALPSGEGTWTQHSDSTLNNVPGSRARSWLNSTPGLALEIDMEVLDSSSTAETAWPTWKNGISGKVSGSGGACPSGAPSNCVELNGTSTSHSDESEVILAWQQSNTLVAVVLVNAKGSASASYAEQVASAEGDQIGKSGS